MIVVRFESTVALHWQYRRSAELRIELLRSRYAAD